MNWKIAIVVYAIYGAQLLPLFAALIIEPKVPRKLAGIMLLLAIAMMVYLHHIMEPLREGAVNVFTY